MSQVERPMQCANPDCSTELLYLRDGSLRLLELQMPAEVHVPSDDTGFSIRLLPRKFFWLCGACTEVLVISQWTASGLVLKSRCNKEGENTESRIAEQSRWNAA
jgi:hypothetical protein